MKYKLYDYQENYLGIIIINQNNIQIEASNENNKIINNLINKIKNNGLTMKKSIINNGVIEEITTTNIDPKDFEILFIEKLIELQYLVKKI